MEGGKRKLTKVDHGIILNLLERESLNLDFINQFYNSKMDSYINICGSCWKDTQFPKEGMTKTNPLEIIFILELLRGMQMFYGDK